jgi:tRNA A-37 threonylcarbamoyl transferase component Bud32
MSAGRSSQEGLPQLGDYSILEHLATGGMAEVYLARKVGVGRFEKLVVIKRIRPELTNDARTTGLFLDEARLVATLEHPNIAQVYEIDQVGDSYFIVMEYVQGADLRRLIQASRKRKTPIPLDDAIYVITHVCAALHYAHEKRDHAGRPLDIVHRDISPSNVLVSHDGAVKVCDFGIASGRDRETETIQGVIKGKLSYLSPEQCRSEPLDRRSDVFAIGILLYELSTSTKLFEAASEFELLRTIVEAPIKPPSRLIAGYPEGLSDIVMKALAKRPENRYATAQEMQLALESFGRERKLEMSSINIARLMSVLFVKPAGGGRPAHGFHEGDADTDVDTGEQRAAEPAPAPAPRPEPQPAPVAAPVAAPAAARAPNPSRRPSVLWLVGALLAGVTAIALPYLVPATGPSTAALERELHRSADQLGSTIDSAAHASSLEIERLASSPVLRAGITTDAATMQDLVSSEHALIAAPNEVIEVFQLRGGTLVPMLRLPASARPLEVPATVHDQTTQLTSDGHGLRVLAISPITGPGGNGAVATSVPIDLTLEIQSLRTSVHSARLVGVTPELTLVDSPDEALIMSPARVRVPSSAGGSALAITATMDAAVRPVSWVLPVQLVAAALACALVICFVLVVARRRDA